LTVDQVERLVAEYEAGDDMAALAARWGLHRTTVAALLRRAGVKLRRQGIPGEQLDEAVRLYAEGWSCQRLAERYGCDDETVRQALKQAGVRCGHRGRGSTEGHHLHRRQPQRGHPARSLGRRGATDFRPAGSAASSAAGNGLLDAASLTAPDWASG
jgi:Homeodomain-like domain-containing protein